MSTKTRQKRVTRKPAFAEINEEVAISIKQKLTLNLKRIEPLTKNQELVFKYRNEHQLLYGSAGTGKTFLALYHALDDIIERELFKKVIIIRSICETRKIGFLPGTEKEKSAAYELPYQEICAKLFARPDAYEVLKAKGIIDFRTTSFLRGITLSDCVIIFDEFQNETSHGINSVMTRVGSDSRMVICGDVTQDDLRQHREISGAKDTIKVLEAMDVFTKVHFELEDIVRSGFVKSYLTARSYLEKSGAIARL